MRRLLEFELGYPYCLYLPELGEEIVIAVHPVLVEDENVQGFIPTEIVAVKCVADASKTKVIVSYDDSLLSSYDSDTEKANRPLCPGDILCTISDHVKLNWLQAYVETRLN